MNIAIVLAGGVGTRVGAGIPKQFIKVLGKPIMIYTLETYQADPLVDEIVLVCVDTHKDQAKQLCKQYGIDKITATVSGGPTFVASCINGMKSLSGKCKSDDIVVVTSADRPFTSREEIEDSILVAKEQGSGIAARKCALCMFEVGEDKSCSDTYLRDTLVQTATPWSFKYGPFMDALSRFENGEFPGCEAYPTAIYVAAGHRAYFSKSFPQNIKITEKPDIALMEQMLIEREKNEY